MDSCSKGEVGELGFCKILIQNGYEVSRTLASRRYDIIAVKDNIFSRIQIKTAKVRGSALVFKTSNQTGSYQGQVEYFGVYWPLCDAYYLIPAERYTKSKGTLHLSRPKKVHVGALYAEDFELKSYSKTEFAC